MTITNTKKNKIIRFYDHFMKYGVQYHNLECKNYKYFDDFFRALRSKTNDKLWVRIIRLPEYLGPMAAAPSQSTSSSGSTSLGHTKVEDFLHFFGGFSVNEIFSENLTK